MILLDGWLRPGTELQTRERKRERETTDAEEFKIAAQIELATENNVTVLRTSCTLTPE